VRMPATLPRSVTTMEPIPSDSIRVAARARVSSAEQVMAGLDMTSRTTVGIGTSPGRPGAPGPERTLHSWTHPRAPTFRCKY
jgi:hypothetical protein